MIQITRSGRNLVWWRGRRLPGRGVEVKELGHIHLRGVACREAVQVEARLNQLEDRCVVGHGMGDIILFRKR